MYGASSRAQITSVSFCSSPAAPFHITQRLRTTLHLLSETIHRNKLCMIHKYLFTTYRLAAIAALIDMRLQ